MIAVVATAGDRYATQVTTDDGHEITIDEPVAAGGADSGASPKRLLAAAIASCVSITIRMYAERKEWDVSGLEVSVEVDETPRGEPTPVRTEVSLPGHLDEEQRERILRVAGKCPVHSILEGEVHAPVTLAEPG